MTAATGLIPPIATPLQDGKLDVASLDRMLEDIAPHVSGVLVGGGVGEVPSLSLDERLELIALTARRLPSNLLLAVSIADNSFVHNQRLAVAAAEAGAGLLVAACPNYYANDVSMMQGYFAGLSEVVTLDLCLYDNPTSSHTRLSPCDIAAIAEAAPRLTHVKVTDVSIGKVAALKETTSMTVCAGEDAVLWDQSIEADAAMVALPLLFPEEAAAFWSAIERGDLGAAEVCYRDVAPFLHAALGASDYVQVIKTVLHHRGVITSPEVRLPLLPLPPRRRAEVIRAYEAGTGMRAPT